MNASFEIATRLQALAHLGSLRHDEVELPDCGATISVLRPAEFDALLDRAASDPEQNLPYWAEIWPSGVALAAVILGEPGALAQQTVLEIGCGLGITAIAAMRAKAKLLVTDYSEDALALCALNVVAATGHEPEAMRLNWRDSRSVDQLAAAGPFAIVLAADVLYEMRDLDPLLDVVERLLPPGGSLWLAEPQRVPATLFVETLVTRGWYVRVTTVPGPWPDPEDNRKGVVVNVHRLRRPGD